MLNILPLFRNVFDFTTVSSTIHSSQQQLPALFAHLPAPKRLRHQLLNPDYLSLPPIPSPILIYRGIFLLVLLSHPPLFLLYRPSLEMVYRPGEREGSGQAERGCGGYYHSLTESCWWLDYGRRGF